MRNLIEGIEVVNDGIKRSSPFREPVPSVGEIEPSVVVAMDSYVVPVLGRQFYDLLVIEKAGRVSIYNPSIRLDETVSVAFTKAIYEDLWTNGGLRNLCAWAVALTCLPTLGTQIKQGGVVRYEGGGDASIDEQKSLTQSWERGVEVLEKKVRDYLKGKINIVGFEAYNDYIIKKGCDDEPIFREVGLLKMEIPRW